MLIQSRTVLPVLRGLVTGAVPGVQLLAREPAGVIERHVDPVLLLLLVVVGGGTSVFRSWLGGRAERLSTRRPPATAAAPRPTPRSGPHRLTSR